MQEGAKTEADNGQTKRSEPRLTLSGIMAGWIAWLAGALGVIGGVLYASGYLISIAQLHLLGLSRLVTYSQDYFVQQGGTFFLYIGEESMKLVFNSIPVLLLAALYRWTKPLLARRCIWLRLAVAGRSNLWRELAYAGLFILLVLTWYVFESGDKNVLEALTLSNVLFSQSGDVNKQVENLLINGKRDFETRYFQDVFLILLFFASFYVTRGWSARRLLMVPFAVQPLLYTLSLPMLFGVLYLPAEFPIVTVSFSDAAPLDTTGPIYMLTKRDGEVVLYYRDERKVVWLAQERVQSIVVDHIARILPDTLPAGREPL